MFLVDEKFIGTVCSLVETAHKSIIISTFKAEISRKQEAIKLRRFYELLAEKAKAGIKVFFLLNWHDEQKAVPKTNMYAIKFLKENNVKVRYLKYNRCCHAKLIIIDEEVCVIGSHNLSLRSVNNNFEVSAILTGKENIMPAVEVFKKVWQDAKKA